MRIALRQYIHQAGVGIHLDQSIRDRPRLAVAVVLRPSGVSIGNESNALRSLAEGLDRRLYDMWPETNRHERAMFQKLKEAYTKARYSKHYRISEEELTWLGERVEELGRVVHQVCTDKIAELEIAARE